MAPISTPMEFSFVGTSFLRVKNLHTNNFCSLDNLNQPFTNVLKKQQVVKEIRINIYMWNQILKPRGLGLQRGNVSTVFESPKTQDKQDGVS
uniref:Uncharacterized protein n=1 Tax=Vespula pensylvanica TaxID=30213 RepID=A0A834NQJ9_VESPE|nr:hypothetical protein H0235_012206 [Vespula pensylvanica]